jgi:hypothetical protein
MATSIDRQPSNLAARQGAERCPKALAETAPIAAGVD